MGNKQSEAVFRFRNHGINNSYSCIKWVKFWKILLLRLHYDIAVSIPTVQMQVYWWKCGKAEACNLIETAWTSIFSLHYSISSENLLLKITGLSIISIMTLLKAILKPWYMLVRECKDLPCVPFSFAFIMEAIERRWKFNSHDLQF